MLLELSGLGMIKDVIVKSPQRVFVYIDLQSHKTRKGKTTTFCGERVLKFTGDHATRFLRCEANKIGSLIKFIAFAETIDTETGFSDQYRIEEFNIICEAGDIQTTDTYKAYLRGVGKIVSVTQPRENVANVLLRSEVALKSGITIKGIRVVRVMGKGTDWLIQEKEKLVGHYYEFKARASTSIEQVDDGVTFHDYYAVERSNIVWDNNISTKES